MSADFLTVPAVLKIFGTEKNPAFGSFSLLKISQKLQTFLKIAGTVFLSYIKYLSHTKNQKCIIMSIELKLHKKN